MFPDEGSRQNFEAELEDSYNRSDPAGALRAKTDLLALNSELRARVHSFERSIRGLRSELANAKKDVSAKERELERVQAKYSGILASRSWKTIKFMSEPIRKVRRLRKHFRSTQGRPVGTRLRDTLTFAIETELVASRSRVQTVTKTACKAKFTQNLVDPPAQIADESLKEAIDSLNRTWFTDGSISKSADMARHISSNWKGQLSKKNNELIKNIFAEERLNKTFPQVPPRSSGRAIIVERDRVMYCAHSTPVFNSNGYSTRTQGVVRGLRENGEDVFVVSRLGYPWDTAIDRSMPSEELHVSTMDGVEYRHVPGANLHSDPIDLYLISAADAFVRQARVIRPSVIHSASNFRTALPALIAARRLGIPFVYEVRGLWEVTGASNKPGWEKSERYELMSRLETLVASQADRVLTITSEVADELATRGVPRANIELAPNAVDPQIFMPLPKDLGYAASKKIRTDVPVIGFAGSIVSYEGLELLVRASSQLDQEGIEHQVVVAGSGAEVDRLKSLRNELKAAGVLFLGRIPADEVPQLISNFDIMPVPRLSLPVTEMVSPLKPLEAFSCGKAVLMSNVSPHRTLESDHDGNALATLFDAGSTSSLVDGLKALISDKDLRATLGMQARLWVIDKRTWTKIGADIKRAHHRALEEYDENIASGQVDLRNLKVGLIADEFTTKTLKNSVKIIPLTVTGFEAALRKYSPDVVLIESAWAGNGGQWEKGVGYYESEKNNRIFRLIDLCRRWGIPTIFWNKEDPVHFERFVTTASRCAAVFTTDSNKIPDYWRARHRRTTIFGSIPFFADPAIHNPLKSATTKRNTVAFAGTYYGDKYRERSEELRNILEVASKYGLDIYDRQFSIENSPYEFPPSLLPFVRGSLPYDQMVDAYKSHLCQINVNSVSGSPTMFSRRVVEVAACGGRVVSSRSQGIAESIGPAIPCVNSGPQLEGLLYRLSEDPEERIRESWLQMRAVNRSHTVQTALAIMFRSVGIPIRVKLIPDYAVEIESCDDSVVASVVGQSQPPACIVDRSRSSQVREAALTRGITVVSRAVECGNSISWISKLSRPVARSHYEDLLSATRYGNWNAIYWRDENSAEWIAEPGEVGESDGALFPLGADGSRSEVERSAPICLAIDPGQKTREDLSQRESLTYETERPQWSELRVLIAGHDLKFAGEIERQLQVRGHHVSSDEWAGHNKHDVAHSKRCLENSDVIFCEWGLGNAVWYSQNKKPNQKLIVRVHSQELRTTYLKKINFENVDKVIFVGNLIRESAVISHGVPREKTTVIPNVVNVEGLALPKTVGADKNIGFVGLVPETKRPDRALDVLEKLLEKDTDYRLFFKGKRAENYPWMASKEDSMRYYREIENRIDQINTTFPGAVTFDGHGSDMEEWYRKIGIAISTSTFESFHFTIADGAASGSRVFSLNWPGADSVYPRRWIYGNVDDMVAAISGNGGGDANQNMNEASALFARRLTIEKILNFVDGSAG